MSGTKRRIAIKEQNEQQQRIGFNNYQEHADEEQGLATIKNRRRIGFEEKEHARCENMRG